MNLASLTTFLKKYLRMFSYGDRVRPQRDWLILMMIMLGILAVSAGWSYWLFEHISSGEAESQSATPATSVKAVSLDTVRTVFDARAIEHTHYLSDYHFVDPSK